MNSTEVVDLFRETVGDLADPYLWTDVEAYRYLDDAQKMFCRLTGGLGDASSPLTQLAYLAGDDWVDISPLILKFRSAAHSDTGRELRIYNMEDMRSGGIIFDGATGRVTSLVLGMEPGRARLHPRAAEDGAISLVVERLPLKTITDAGSQKLEIAEQHHQHLVLWMCHRAYTKQDAEAFDRKKALDSKISFEEYCFAAKLEKERALYKTRTVNYGGY